MDFYSLFEKDVKIETNSGSVIIGIVTDFYYDEDILESESIIIDSYDGSIVEIPFIDIDSVVIL